MFGDSSKESVKGEGLSLEHAGNCWAATSLYKMVQTHAHDSLEPKIALSTQEAARDFLHPFLLQCCFGGNSHQQTLEAAGIQLSPLKFGEGSRRGHTAMEKKVLDTLQRWENIWIAPDFLHSSSIQIYHSVPCFEIFKRFNF